MFFSKCRKIYFFTYRWKRSL